jgi:AmmeMemoRadiSam system protein A
MSPLTETDQRLLLRLARTELEATLLISWPGSRLSHVPVSLVQPCGAFVTLRMSGQLRGCVGRVRTFLPLHKTVRDCAVAAALSDPRFPPTKASELSSLLLEISVLSPPVEAKPEEVELGRHGLLVSQGSKRGLLLPQVATEWNWDRTRFLEEACIKAGLSSNAWLRGARIETFTAQVFSESDMHEQNPRTQTIQVACVKKAVTTDE